MQHAFNRRQFVQRLLGTCAIGAGAASLAGCSSNLPLETASTGANPPTTAPEAPGRTANAAPVMVGLILPLGGSPQTAAIAKSLQQAAEMAIFERSNAGLQLSVKDDKGTPDGAKAAAEELIKAGAEIIAGPLFSRSVAPVAQVARPAGVPVLTFSNDPTVAGQGVYLLSFMAESEIDRVVEHAVGQGRRSFAALLPNGIEGKIAEPAFRTAVERRGARVAFIDHYDVDQGGIVEPSRKLKEAFSASDQSDGAIDALFIPAGADTLPQLSFLVGQARVNPQRVKLLGTSGWDFPTVGRDPRLHGSWFAAPDPRGWRDFSARFSKTYGYMPPRLASLAFDAVDIASTFAGQPKGARFTAQNLTRGSGFAGADGPIRFTANGRSERGLAILEVQKQGPAVIEAAPATLAASSPLATPGIQRSAAGIN